MSRFAVTGDREYSASAPLPFVAITPCREYDSRSVGVLPENTPRSVPLTGAPCGIPSSAEAVAVNITVFSITGAGSNGVFKVGTASPPTTAWLNYPPTETQRGNAGVLPLNPSGAIVVQVNQGAGSVNFVVDVFGYYAPQAVVTSLNALTGALTLAGGSGVTVNASGSTLTISGPTPSGTMTIGQPGDTTLLGSGYTETWAAGMDSWLAMPSANAPPNLARAAFCSVWTGSKFFVWGGQDINYQGLNTGSLYDPATNSWTLTGVSGAAAARRYPHCVWTGSKVVVWGGEDSVAVAMNSGSRYDPVLDTWSAMTTTAAPQGRIVAAAVWSGSRMVVWGGVDRTSGPYTFPVAGGRYDPVNDVWEGLSVTSQPTPRGQPSFVWTGSKLIVWGGYTGAGVPFTQHNTGGRYDPVADTWQSTTTTNALSARMSSPAVWTGSRMILWGGISGNSPTYVSYNDGALYDPVSDIWTAMSTANAPQARGAPPGVWTGSRMIVWGGTNSSGSSSVPLNTGGIYDPTSNRWLAPTTLTNAPTARSSFNLIWTGSPWNEMLLVGPDSAGYIYRPLSIYVKN